MNQACVAVELKTEDDVRKNGLSVFFAQATLELVAANFLSNQLTVVLLTDLSTSSVIFALDRTVNGTMSINYYDDLSLSQAAHFISDHLINNCVPVTRYVLENGKRKADEVLRHFKKNRVSTEDSLAVEHFKDMIEETVEFSDERAETIKQLFRSYDITISSFLQGDAFNSPFEDNFNM